MNETRTRLTRAQQQERTRERLLAAAGEVFAEHGFDGASIDEITARAGFSRGAFYSNFADKIDLLITLCDRRIERFATEELPRVLAAPEEDRLPAVARWLAESTPSEVLLIVELARHREHGPETAASLERAIDRIVTAVRDLLTVEGSELAALPPGELEVRARAALAAVLGMDLLGYLGVPADARTIEVLLAGVADTSHLDVPDDDRAGTEGAR